jgi:CheY-like chemotaxis protein
MRKLRKILLVEDNPNDIELTLEALSDQNLTGRVIVVNDGAEAMDYMYYKGRYQNREKENPAVIFLDIKMPRMDGLEVLGELKSDMKLKIIPVVMLTSSREEPDLKKCYELGANAYVVKPFNFKDFTDAVKQLGLFWAILNVLPSNGGENYE